MVQRYLQRVGRLRTDAVVPDPATPTGAATVTDAATDPPPVPEPTSV
jgi:hypothetical protein